MITSISIDCSASASRHELAERPHAATPPLGPTLALCRVTTVHAETLQLHDGAAERPRASLPALRRSLIDAGDALTVGDWVLASATITATPGCTTRIEPTTQIVRRDCVWHAPVAVVSNVDTALLVMGLDDDFNLRRLERYLALVHASRDAGTSSSLTKGDMSIAADARRDAARRRAAPARYRPSSRWMLVAATDSAERGALVPAGCGQTLVVLGSSGAGKSTLTNTLLGAQVQATGGVREHDSRGRHTTTARSLHSAAGPAPASSTRRASGRCARMPMKKIWPRPSRTFKPCRSSAASAIAVIGTSPAAQCAPACTTIGWRTTRRCCARFGATR